MNSPFNAFLVFLFGLSLMSGAVRAERDWPRWLVLPTFWFGLMCAGGAVIWGMIAVAHAIEKGWFPLS